MGLTGIRQLLAQGGLTLRTQAADDEDEDDEDQVSQCRLRAGHRAPSADRGRADFSYSGTAPVPLADQAWPSSGTQSRSQSRLVRSSILVASLAG